MDYAMLERSIYMAMIGRSENSLEIIKPASRHELWYVEVSIRKGRALTITSGDEANSL
jgi:hypothetical protein